MNKLLKVALGRVALGRVALGKVALGKVVLGCALVTSVGLLSGCSAQSNTDREFEQQIRAPKGPPPPEAVEAMKRIEAAEAKGKPLGR